MSMLQTTASPTTEAKPNRKRNAAKAATTNATGKAKTEKVKATIHLDPKAAKMLGVFAVMTDESNSGVVEKLIFQHLKRYVVSDRGPVETAAHADQATPEVSSD